MIPIELNRPYEMGRCWLLQDGDRIHCLSIIYDWERQSWENLIVHYFMKADCRELRDGAFVPCESHSADRWQVELDMFVNGQMDSLTLARRLDERMRMMKLEGLE